MAHPDNEPGKSYDVDDRRRVAALAACKGLPTEWLERGLVQELYKFVALIALADKMAERRNGYVLSPETWWRDHVAAAIEQINSIATMRQ